MTDINKEIATFVLPERTSYKMSVLQTKLSDLEKVIFKCGARKGQARERLLFLQRIHIRWLRTNYNSTFYQGLEVSRADRGGQSACSSSPMFYRVTRIGNGLCVAQ